MLYLFVGIRRPASRRQNLLFAGFAIAYAGAILTARASFLADTPQDFVSANQASLVFAAAALACFAWYVASHTTFAPKAFLWVITTAFALLGGALILAPGLVFADDAGTTVFELPWGETIRALGPDTTPTFLLWVAAQLALFVYTVVATVAQYRRGQRSEALVLAAGIGWLLALLVIENLTAVGVIEVVPVADFGFLGFVVALTAANVNDAIDSERKLRAYRRNLEAMVAARTTELEVAQRQLILQAEEEAAATERSRLARELHDVVTQLLFSINLLAGSLPRQWALDPELAELRTRELQRLTRGALAEMRILLRELRPHTITTTDLPTLMTQLGEGLAARHDMPADIRCTGNGALPEEVHMAFYRIAQEALNNVAKHADASSLTVELVTEPRHAHLLILDDGTGFDPSDARSDAMGIDIMQERATAIGASLTISSGAGRGTSVDVAWEDVGGH